MPRFPGLTVAALEQMSKTKDHFCTDEQFILCFLFFCYLRKENETDTHLDLVSSFLQVTQANKTFEVEEHSNSLAKNCKNLSYICVSKRPT